MRNFCKFRVSFIYFIKFIVSRNLLILWIAQFAAMMALSSVIPFLPLYIMELGDFTTKEVSLWSGLIYAGPFILSFFVTPLWGTLGDKYGRKLMTVRAVFGLAISQLLMGFSADVYQLFFFRVLQGLLSGFYPAAIALVAASTPKEKTGYALGILQSASVFGNVIGPMIGSALAELYGFKYVFLIVGIAVTIISFFVLFGVKENRESGSESNSSSFFSNIEFAFKSKGLKILMILIFFSTFGIGLLRPIIALFVEQISHSKESVSIYTATIFSIISLTSAFSAILLGKQIKSKNIPHFLIFSSMIAAFSLGMHFFISNISLIFILNFIFGIGYGVLMPATFTAVSYFSPSDRKGGVVGVASSFQILGNMLGPLLSSGITQILGIRFLFLIASVSFISIALLTKFSSLSILQKEEKQE